MEQKAPGRNDPCRCGSGKKYKSCCWDKDRSQRIERLAPAPGPKAQAPPAQEAGGKPAKPQGQSWWQLLKDRHPGKKR
ncbi:MAG: SEC-C domain-containing protein [Elusimicrobia bacterium]|nr:SEC-C domain-containing protein [Elusimicrobiota bacterium]